MEMAKFEKYEQGTPSYVELTTPDQAAAKEFYGPLFGWELEEFPMGEAGYYVAVAKEGDSIAGISGQMPGMEGHPAFWGMYMAVDDVDATAAKVVAAGGKVEAEPFDVMDLGRMAAIQDPTGARVNLWQAGATIGTVRANEPGTPSWNELISPDLATAMKFYTEVLGVGWEKQEMEGGMDYTCLMVGGRQVGGAMPPMMEGVPPHWNVYFNVDDVDDTVAKATSLGGSVVAPAFDVPGVGRIGILADPQGGMFNVMTPA
jgi:predicted enzyme related to lactoylglutathione lyase